MRWVHAVVWAVALVILAAVVMKKPSCERFETFTELKPSYDELVKRKVAIVRSLPPVQDRDAATVYFVVDSMGRLTQNPKLPWEGQNYKTVLQEIQDKFGMRAVEATTSGRRKATKVQIVYDARTQEVIKVHVPRQWYMPPRRLRLKSRKRTVRVLLNPRAGTRMATKTLIITTGSDGRVTSATVRG